MPGRFSFTELMSWLFIMTFLAVCAVVMTIGQTAFRFAGAVGAFGRWSYQGRHRRKGRVR